MENNPPTAPRRGLFFATFKRELRNYLQTPGTYVAIAFFLLLSGAFFTLMVGDYAAASAKFPGQTVLPDDELPLNVTARVITQLFSTLNFLLVFIVPILTMRLISEERRSGAFELLVSTPLSNWDILFGKFLAALAVGVMLISLTTMYPLICSLISEPEMPVVFSCYIGLFLILTAYTAFGLFASALTESQIAAAVISFVGLLLFQMSGWLFKAGALGQIGAALSVHKHSENFTKGVIATPDLAFFLFFTIFFLFLATQALDARRWRA